MIFFWDKFNHFAVDALGEIPLLEKPVFSFEYNEIRISSVGDQYRVDDKGEAQELTREEYEEISRRVALLRSTYISKVFAIDVEGKYLGCLNANDPNISAVVGFQPPNADDNWRWIDNNWVSIVFVNEEGLIDATGTQINIPPTFGRFSRWDFATKQWVQHLTLADARLNAQKAFFIWMAEEAIDMANAEITVEITQAILGQLAGNVGNPEKLANLQLITEHTLQEINEHCETMEDYQIVIDGLRQNHL